MCNAQYSCSLVTSDIARARANVAQKLLFPKKISTQTRSLHIERVCVCVCWWCFRHKDSNFHGIRPRECNWELSAHHKQHFPATPICISITQLLLCDQNIWKKRENSALMWFVIGLEFLAFFMWANSVFLCDFTHNVSRKYEIRFNCFESIFENDTCNVALNSFIEHCMGVKTIEESFFPFLLE